MIEAAVGEKSPNKPIDVIRIQDLLNNNQRFTGMSELLDVNGQADDALFEAIQAFQVNHPGIEARTPDGIFSPGGNTLLRLEQCLNDPGCRSTLPRGFDANTLKHFDAAAFVELYARQYPQPPLGAGCSLALKGLVERIAADPDVTDLRACGDTPGPDVPLATWPVRRPPP